MKVFFVNDSTSNPNWGDRAAASSLKQMIGEYGGVILGGLTEQQLALSSLSDHDWGLMGAPTQSGIKECVKQLIPPILLTARRTVKARFGQSGGSWPGDIVPQSWAEFDRQVDLLLQRSSDYSILTGLIKESDVVLIHGNGCMTGNPRIARAELFLAFLAKKAFQKPVIIVNHTVDLNDQVLHTMVANVYPLLDDVVFREPVSAERYGSMCNGRFAPDSAFLYAPAARAEWLPLATRSTYFDVWPDVAEFDPSQPYLCVGGSSILSEASHQSVVESITALVSSLRSFYSGQLVLTVSDLVDEPSMRTVAERFTLPLVGLNTPVQQAVDIVGNADAYVGGRWHPSIFALRGGTPIVSLAANTFKMHALTQMCGLTEHTFDALDVSAHTAEIERTVVSFLSRGDELRNRLRAWAAEQASQSRGNASYLNSGA